MSELKTIIDANIKENGNQEITGKTLNYVLNEIAKEVYQGGNFNAEGNYPLLHVGTADDLAGRGESVPAEFGFRASGGKSIKDGRAYIKRIKGNSIVWNQVYPTGWESIREGIRSVSSNSRITATGTTTATFFRFEPFVDNIADHKYLFMLSGASATFNGKRFGLLNRAGLGQATISNGFAYTFYTNTNASGQRGIGIQDLAEGTEINESLYINQIDLTKAFPNDWENINTIEDFYARVATLGIEDMNTYNEGEVIHCNTESIKSVGDNAWDEEWEVGSITDGVPVNNASRFRSKNYISVLPNSEYYITPPSAMTSNNIMVFYYDANKTYIAKSAWMGINNKSIKTPSNARYIKFVVAENPPYKNDIMITLVHSGWKQDTDAGYQPYWQDTLPLPIISKYFPNGMKSAGTPHDEIYYDKMQNKKFAVQRIEAVKMKDLNWETNANSIFSATINDMYQSITNGTRRDGLLAAGYGISEVTNINHLMTDMSLIRSNEKVYIRNNSYSTAAEFSASLTDDDILYYELAEPIVTELDAEDQHFRDYYNVADFGTEMSQSSVPSAPFSADIIYQFNAVDMIREHELEITELQSIIATMQAQLASLTNS